MNDCPMSSRLTALHEGWLDPEEAEALRRHLHTCGLCRSVLDRLEEAVHLLAREAVPVEPPAAGYEALLEAAQQAVEILPLPARPARRWLVRIAAAAAVLVLAVGSWLLLRQSSPSPTAPVVVTAPTPDDLDLFEEDHALASDRIPFSGGEYMAILAQSGEPHRAVRRDRERK
jgi:anti-sigma factor RsiW